MSLITDSDDYFPANENGTYIDIIPPFHGRPQGFRCPCTGKSYVTRISFAAHIKSDCHKRWVESLNTNSVNYYAELEKEKQVVHQQKLIIAQMEREIAKLEREKRTMMGTIQILSSNINMHQSDNAEPREMDLIDFN